MGLVKYLPKTIKNYIIKSPLYNPYLKLYHRHQNLKFYYRHQILRYKFPTSINIALTYKCNLNCRMCGRLQIVKNGNLDVADMDFDLYRQIIDNFSESNLITPKSVITLVGLGEPLMYPKLPEAFEYATNKLPQTPLYFNVNGTLLDKNMATDLCRVLKEKDRILISINAASRETYQWLMRSDNYDLVAENIKQFLKIREGSKSRPMVKIQLLDTKETHSEIKTFQTIWKPYLQPGVTTYIRRLVETKYIDSHSLRVFDISSSRYPCMALWFVLTIQVNGDIYPCCSINNRLPEYQLKLGNVNFGSIDEIYHSRIKNLRNDHLKDDYRYLTTCEDCKVYAYYKNIWFKILNRFY